MRLTGEISFWSSLALALRSTSLRLSGWILPTPCLFVPASPISQTPGKEGWWGSYLGRLSNVLVVTKQLVNGGSGCWGLGWLKGVLFRRSKSTPPHTPTHQLEGGMSLRSQRGAWTGSWASFPLSWASLLWGSCMLSSTQRQLGKEQGPFQGSRPETL